MSTRHRRVKNEGMNVDIRAPVIRRTDVSMRTWLICAFRLVAARCACRHKPRPNAPGFSSGTINDHVGDLDSPLRQRHIVAIPRENNEVHSKVDRGSVV